MQRLLKTIPVEREVETLKEQVIVLRTISKLAEKQKPKSKLTLREYRKYLRSTKGKVKFQAEPTEFIRSLRTKGDFY